MKKHLLTIPQRYWAMLLFFCILCPPRVQAKVKLPSLIADGMVLQREESIKIWGTAEAGEHIRVEFTRQNRPHTVAGEQLKSVFTATADNEGKWSITLPPMKAGGPYTLQINEVRLQDILIGDVWLCSGQSNMELPVRRVTDMFQEEIVSYENHRIRQFRVPNTFNFQHAQDEFTESSSWKPLTQEYVMEFSALAYFFAKEMFEKNNIPIGLINASWGGTPVEAWISENGLKEFPKYINEKRQYEDDNFLRSIKQTESIAFARWNNALYKGDTGLHEATPWFSASYNDSNWQEVDLFSTNWGTNGLNAINGSHWFRKEVEVPQSWEGKGATLRLGCIVDADSVFVNGQFVGTTSYQYPPRVYTVPAGILKGGKNNITVRLISNAGYPHFVREKPYKLIQGNESINLEGKWKYRLGAPMPSAPNMTFFFYKPVCLYNSMIHPLRNYAIRGAIWYQGESNVSRRNEYGALLTSLIGDWRDTFKQPQLPFYIVELADFLAPDNPGRKAWAEMRKVQAQVAEQTPQTWLIPNGDLGEWNDIHPLDKKTVGQRIVNRILDTNK